MSMISASTENEADRLLEDPCGLYQYGGVKTRSCCRAEAEATGRNTELLFGNEF